MLFISILVQALVLLMTIFAFGVIVLMAMDFIRNPEWKKDHPLD